MCTTYDPSSPVRSVINTVLFVLCHFLFSVELSLLRFLSAELTRGYFLEHNEAKYTERRERVYTCMRIPRELEKVLFFISKHHLKVLIVKKIVNSFC